MSDGKPYYVGKFQRLIRDSIDVGLKQNVGELQIECNVTFGRDWNRWLV